MNQYLKAYARRGLKSLIIPFDRRGTGGTVAARYCYSVWLRHLVNLHANGATGFFPKVVAELGPGDSIGIGICTLLTGADVYYGLDMIKHANTERNLQILDELVVLFKNREPIPSEGEYPRVKPYLADYSFPKDILTDELLDKLLVPDRIESIRKAISGDNSGSIKICYLVPWENYKKPIEHKFDLILSQAVLEHIIRIDHAFGFMHKNLSEKGYMSHQIDYKAHEFSTVWNEHWGFNSFLWKLAMIGRGFPMNRLPHSAYLKLLDKYQFVSINEQQVIDENGLRRNNFKGKFKQFTDSDYKVSGALIQVKK
jgi:hypothetical protein